MIPVPPPSDAPALQDFPPSASEHLSWPRDIAVSPNGRTLLVALNLADAAAVIDTTTGNVRYVSVGHYPYGAGITTDGRFGLVTSETQGTVSVIDLASGQGGQEPAGGAAALPSRRASPSIRRRRSPSSANANQDTITVIDTKSMSVARTLSVERPQGVGTSPTYVSVTPDGCDLLSADSGEDAVAVFALSKGKRCGEGGKPPGKKKGKKGSASTAQFAAKQKGKGKKKSDARKAKTFQLVGRIPTGSYPTVAAATPKRRQLVWVSARGLGVGPNPNGPNPNTGDDTYLDQYLPSIVDGASGVLNYPSDRKIRKLTPISDRQVIPADARTAPRGHPDPRRRADQARLLHRSREPHVRPGARR